MWIRKDASVVVAEAKARKRRSVSLAVAVSTGVGYCVAKNAIWQAQPAGGFTGTMRWITVGTAASVVLAAVLWWCRRFDRKHATMICQQCNKVKTADAKLDCACGGKFLSLKEMKWEDVPGNTGNPCAKSTKTCSEGS